MLAHFTSTVIRVLKTVFIIFPSGYVILPLQDSWFSFDCTLESLGSLKYQCPGPHPTPNQLSPRYGIQAWVLLKGSQDWESILQGLQYLSVTTAYCSFSFHCWAWLWASRQPFSTRNFFSLKSLQSTGKDLKNQTLNHTDLSAIMETWKTYRTLRRQQLMACEAGEGFSEEIVLERGFKGH